LNSSPDQMQVAMNAITMIASVVHNMTTQACSKSDEFCLPRPAPLPQYSYTRSRCSCDVKSEIISRLSFHIK
jgi:hypothetical protein